MSAKACNSGNSDDMISRHFSRDTELNMFVISSETSGRKGVLPFRSGSEMYLSTPKRIELTTKSTPPLTPSAKLKGSRCLAKMALFFWITHTAVMRHIAEGIPSGRSFFLFVGSFSSATRYVV